MTYDMSRTTLDVSRMTPKKFLAPNKFLAPKNIFGAKNCFGAKQFFCTWLIRLGLPCPTLIPLEDHRVPI